MPSILPPTSSAGTAGFSLPSPASALQSRGPQHTDRSPRAALRAACCDFESIFLSLLYRQMRSTVPSGGILPRGAAEDILDSLWTQEISRLSAQSSPLGIADALVSALSNSVNDQTPLALKPAAPPTEDITEMPRRALLGRDASANQRPAGSPAPADAGGRNNEDHE